MVPWQLSVPHCRNYEGVNLIYILTGNSLINTTLRNYEEGEGIRVCNLWLGGYFAFCPPMESGL